MNELITLVAKYLYLVVIAIGLILFFSQPREIKKKWLMLSVVTLPLAFVLGKIASALFNNPRPFVVEKVTPLISHANTNGFPSDHTLISVTLAAIVFAFNKKLGIVLIILGILVGVARVLAKVHHPVDIVASVIIATASTTVSWFMLKRFVKDF